MIVNVLLAMFLFVILYGFIQNGIMQKGEQIFLDRKVTDSLRGFAIVAIIFSHICQQEPSLNELIVGGKESYSIIFSFGGIGVAIFFLLSGYGCYLSITKTDNIFNWLIKRVTKMIVYFIVSFIYVILIRKFILSESFKVKECVKCLFTLKLPGTSSWYFKIQLLFYVLLVVSYAIKKNQCFIVTFLVGTYAVVASVCGLPDYWWKTSACFAAGCVIAKHRELINKYMGKIWIKGLLLMTAIVAYMYTRIDFHYLLIPQIGAYVLISACIVAFWNWIAIKNPILSKCGGV